MLKLISYNVNGVRAAMNKGLTEWLAQSGADVVCFQEIKATHNQIDMQAFEALGYTYHYWYPAQKKGYSGTAVLSKVEPQAVHYGMGMPAYDDEGRAVRLDFKDFSLLCTYFPSGSSGDERQAFKMQFLADFLPYANQLREQHPNLIITGDLNICHKPIDINFPKKHEKMSGFLPEERAWFDSFVEAGYVDTFRMFNDQPEQYSWWSYRSRAREKNLGWRIDYFMCSEAMKGRIKAAAIHPDAVHSDHCPISVHIE